MAISFEQAEKRFLEQGRIDIELCKDGYVSWTKKSKFYDLIINEFFWSVPKRVYVYKTQHPKRSVETRKQTNLLKYGVTSPAGNKSIQEKIKKTNIEKYGVDCNFKSEYCKEKIKQTNLIKYGAENPFGSVGIKEKIKKTNIEKYGVEYFVYKLTNRYISETGEHLKDWLEKQPEPKPAYITYSKNFPNEKLTLKEVEDFFNNYKSNKTSLEVLGENLFNSQHFNKKPNEIKRLYRPDFKLSDVVYVNVDGLYWHSEKEVNKKYHFEMRKEFEENNLRLFQFYENEIQDKPKIIKSIVNNSLGQIKNKIYARNCKIKIIDHETASKFLEKNHLMGSTTAKHVGLVHNDNVVSLLSYKEKKNICKIERFCSLIDYNVIGGFSKLLKYLEKNLLKSTTTEIHNWVDLRYGSGKHLESKGFKLIKETLGWKWTDRENTFNRLQCRANMDERKLTEKEHAEELGWLKIYDAGQRLYVKEIEV